MSTYEEKLEQLGSFLIQARVKESFRENRPVSQATMAKRIGIPQGSLSQYENKMRLPDEKNIHRLAAYLGVEVYDILEQPRRLPNDPVLLRLALVWPSLTKDMKKKLVSMAEDEYDQLQERMKEVAGSIKAT